MSSTDTLQGLQTDPSPEDIDMDDAPTSQPQRARPIAFNSVQGLAYRPRTDQNPQISQQGTGDNHQSNAGANSRQDDPPARAQAHELTQGHPTDPPWPTGGFFSDDPATAHLVAIMQSLEERAPSPTAAEGIIGMRTLAETKRKNQPFEQLWRRRRRPGEKFNFFLPFPDRPGSMMGKTSFSKAGLAIILEALRSVVRGYGMPVSVAPLTPQVEELNAGGGIVHFMPAVKSPKNYYCDINPFTLIGARMALAVAQAASHESHSPYMLFYAYALTDAAPRQSMSARLEVQPIKGWDD